MRKFLLFAVAVVFAGSAAAQQYKWVDKDGKVRYGDTPPAGVKATPLKPPPPGVPAPASAPASKGPLTSAEKEAEFRKRQIEGEKLTAKEQQARQEMESRKENCARAQETLRSVEGGQRIARTDAKGERYFLDESQMAQEKAKASASVNQWCN
jgi:type IV secretory pathway VirB10-like protein